ncbi:glycosyltransferase family 2 protein [Olleya sp. R77988]|uniref:glycosyltransferase family 2 protein n=1 Tax=Olleya sp. R77988 TaxID=3093875 RepID=UPI0037C58149
MKNLKTTLLIATYNWPKALELVLLSVLKQSQLPDEIIIADDGSTEDTKLLIDSFKTQFSIPVKHIWQVDNGFKKAHILNKAVAQSSGEYIIQVDGDCIMHHHFIKDHLQFVKDNTYLFGSRVNIQKSHLETLFSSKQIRFNAFSKGIKKRTRALHIPFLSQLYKPSTEFSSKFRGCNASYFRKDFIAVNGYNEDITGWGREDSELVLRFHNIGLQARRLRYRSIVFHIYHNEKSRDRFEINDSIEQETVNKKIKWAKNGVDKYLA